MDEGMNYEKESAQLNGLIIERVNDRMNKNKKTFNNRFAQKRAFEVVLRP